MVQESIVQAEAGSVALVLIALGEAVFAVRVSIVQAEVGSVVLASTALAVVGSVVLASIAPVEAVFAVRVSIVLEAVVFAALASTVPGIETVKPTLARELYIHHHNQRVLYFNPEPPDWITINEVYKPIFDRFDGNNTQVSITSFINNHFPDEREILVPQIDEFIKTSKVLEHNSSEVRPHGAGIENDNIAPKYVYITLTDRCNLRCQYCYAVERSKAEDVGFGTWSRYIHDILKVADTPIFIFTGGEPLLIHYIYDLAALTKEAGCENILLSNGTKISSLSEAKRVADVFKLVKLSLDTLDDKVASLLRGQGIVNKVQRAFDLLKEANCNVQILATVTSVTCKDLDTFSKHFENQVNFQPFYTMGRGRGTNDLVLTGEEYYEALTQTDIFRLLPGFHRNIHGYRNRPFKRCAMAREEISIDPAGNVYPCHMVHYPEFNCGNLNTTDFAVIYKHSPVLTKLRALSVDSMEQCKTCVFRNICGGSCRARVDILKNRIDGSNEFCTFEKKAILDALMYSYG